MGAAFACLFHRTPRAGSWLSAGNRHVIEATVAAGHGFKVNESPIVTPGDDNRSPVTGFIRTQTAEISITRRSIAPDITKPAEFIV